MKTNFFKSNLWPAVFLIALALVFYAYAGGLVQKTGKGLGADFVPRLWAGLLILLSLFMIAQSFFMPTYGDLMEQLTKKSLIVTVITFLALVLYAIAMNWLGYFISTVLFLAALLVLYGERKILLIGGVSLAVTLCLFWVFQEFLGVPLPNGVFE